VSALPESPVREYAKRVAASLAEQRDVLTESLRWSNGYLKAIDHALSILAVLEPEPGTETTRFEYRVVGGPGGGAWHPSCDGAREAYMLVRPGPFDDLFIERRTVAVTQPVRVDQDGEPVS
jgi:hypothetical protein